MNNKPIGVFDSGVGGLSILREVSRRLPQEQYLFFADQANVPYGEKTKTELVALTHRIMEFFMAHDAKLVVVACNTATCYAIDEMRAAFPIPIVGVVPAIKLAVEQTATKHIALIATPATAKSDAVTELIEKFVPPDVSVERIGCFKLEDVVETGSLDSPESLALLSSYIAPLKEKNIDRLVLGCTHYPFLKKQIATILGDRIGLVDSGEAIANRVESVLRERDMLGSSDSPTSHFFTSKNAEDFSRVASKLLGREIVGTHVAL
jgi:glutamate racemase